MFENKWFMLSVFGLLGWSACSSNTDSPKHEVLLGASALSAARPSYNTGAGFFTSGGKLFDANGNEFIIRGTNYEVWADVAAQNTAIAGMNRAGLNAARLNFPNGTRAGTETFNAQTVQRFVAAGIVPIVAVWSPSGRWPSDQDPTLITTCSEHVPLLNEVVDNWVGPQRAWLISQERNVILNIANEWGEADTVWRDSYISAITRLRNAGIKATIMVDAGGGCGQNSQSIESYGPAIAAADPQRNVVFSLHPYGYWRSPGTTENWGDPFPNERQPYDMASELARVKNTGLPIVLGEYCGWQADDCQYTATTALSTFESLGLGYMSWEWMNVHVPYASVTLDNAYNSSSDLTGWGRTTIEHPTLGSKVLGRKATIFGSGAGGSGAGGSGAGGSGAAGSGAGGAAGSGGPGGAPNSGSNRYGFETGTQGWLSSTSGVTLSRSATQRYEGSYSLAARINATGAQTKSTQVDDPATPAGATVTARVWCPSGARIRSVTAWVQHGGSANGACIPYLWTGNSVPLAAGQWNTVSVTVPSCSIGLSHLGVDFDTSGAWTGSCYIDAVSW